VLKQYVFYRTFQAIVGQIHIAFIVQTILLPLLKVSYGVIANSKVSQKQDIFSDLQDEINPVHPVNPVRKIDG